MLYKHRLKGGRETAKNKQKHFNNLFDEEQWKKYKQSLKGEDDPRKTGQQRNKFSEFCPVFNPASVPRRGKTQKEQNELYRW